MPHLQEVESQSIFDIRFGVYNKRYLMKAINDELKLIKHYCIQRH